MRQSHSFERHWNGIAIIIPYLYASSARPRQHDPSRSAHRRLGHYIPLGICTSGWSAHSSDLAGASLTGATASLGGRDLARRSDDATSSSNGVVDYIVSAIAYVQSSPATSDSTHTHTATNSSSLIPSSMPSHGYVNSSSTVQSTNSSPASAHTSLDSILSRGPGNSASSEPVAYHSPTISISNSTNSPTYPASNFSSSQVVTAVYSRTHVFVVNSGSYLIHSSAWRPTGHSPNRSANNFSDSLASNHPSEPSVQSYGEGALNSTLPIQVGSSGSIPLPASGYYGSNGSVLGGQASMASPQRPGTGLYLSNATPSYAYGITDSVPLQGTGYPISNGSFPVTAAAGTGFEQYKNQPNATTAIPRTGFGYSYAQACNKASVDWSSRWLQDQVTSDTMVTDTKGYTPGQDDVYTLCDGVPRMRVNLTTSFAPYKHWSVVPPVTISGAPPQPNCTVVPSDCAQLLSSYVSQKAERLLTLHVCYCLEA